MLLPPSYRYLSHQGEPIIFLAGPIQGAADWQTDAAAIISRLRPDVWIANPRRAVPDGTVFTAEMYDEQVEWELDHLKLARKYGVVLFWCANEHLHDCGRAYAQTTRIEAGMTVMHTVYSRARAVIGLDDAFTGAKYIRKTVPREAPHVPILDSLADTVTAAINALR